MGKKYVEDSSVALALNIHNCLAIVWTERQRASNDSFEIYQGWIAKIRTHTPENQQMDTDSSKPSFFVSRDRELIISQIRGHWGSPKGDANP